MIVTELSYFPGNAGIRGGIGSPDTLSWNQLPEN